jgi:hypothetical protein
MECSFNIDDLVLRRIQNTEGLQNLSSPWEGPFLVSKVTGPGCYHLQTLKAMTSATHGMSTSCVASTCSHSTNLWVQVYTTTHGLLAVSGLPVLALVSRLLFSKIQCQRLLTDLGLFKALRTLVAVCKTMYSRSSLYGYQRISSCKQPWALAPLSCRRPAGPGDYTCKRPWPPSCTYSSVIKFDFL